MTTPQVPITPGPPEPDAPGHGIGLEPSPPPAKPWYRDWQVMTRVIIGGAAALVVVGGCAVFALRGPDDVPEDQQAKGACREFVERRLVAPDTASYAGLTVGRRAGDGWVVRGDVTAKNRLGVPIRMSFTCATRRDGGDWVLVSLTGLDG